MREREGTALRRSGSDMPLAGRVAHVVEIAGAALVADCAGALYWPEQNLLAFQLRAVACHRVKQPPGQPVRSVRRETHVPRKHRMEIVSSFAAEVLQPLPRIPFRIESCRADR